MPALLEPTLDAHRDAIAALCRAHGVAMLEVFDSAASGGFNPASSDYDLIARFLPRENESLARRYVAFSEALEGLLGRPVDVLTEQAIRNPYLRRAIDASRQPLYVGTSAQAPA